MIQSSNQSKYRFDTKVGTSMESNFPWKQTILKYMIASTQKNMSRMDISANTYQDDTVLHTGIRNNIFLPQPLKIYRKEIGNQTINQPSKHHIGITIESMEMPGSSITISSHTPLPPRDGLDIVVLDRKEMGDSNNRTNHPGQCQSFTTGGICMDPATNARRRVRTSGIIKPNYSTTIEQYLYTRNKTFQQNQFQFVQSGNTSSQAGTAAAANNVYGTQCSPSSWAIYDISGTLSTCSGTTRPFTPVYYKPNNPLFAQQGAVDSSTHILRRKFDTITNNTAQYKRVYGSAVASAMGYGISDSVYTLKQKIGFPLKKTPVITPYKPNNNCCS